MPFPKKLIQTNASPCPEKVKQYLFNSRWVKVTSKEPEKVRKGKTTDIACLCYLNARLDNVQLRSVVQ